MRCWTRSLQQKVKSEENRVLIKNELIKLRNYRSKEVFDEELNQFLGLLGTLKEIDFLNYFMCYYVCIVSEWSYAYRHIEAPNTNMVVESAWKVFKYSYLGGRLAYSINDVCLHLLDYCKDTGIKHRTKIARGRGGKRARQTFENHRKVTDMMADYILAETDDGNFLVVSQTKKTAYQLIANSDSDPQCGEVCKDCSSCKHEHSCSCSRYTYQKEFCKHLHYLYYMIKDGVKLNCSSPLRRRAHPDRAAKKQKRN